jgi:hypothetical protein
MHVITILFFSRFKICIYILFENGHRTKQHKHREEPSPTGHPMASAPLSQEHPDMKKETHNLDHN